MESLLPALNMTDVLWINILTSLPVTITAITALVVGWRNSRRTEVVIKKADEIHILTNANLAKVTAALEVANSKIVNLERLISGLTVSNIDRRITSDSPLIEIEKNTKETAEVLKEIKDK